MPVTRGKALTSHFYSTLAVETTLFAGQESHCPHLSFRLRFRGGDPVFHVAGIASQNTQIYTRPAEPIESRRMPGLTR